MTDIGQQTPEAWRSPRGCHPEHSGDKSSGSDAVRGDCLEPGAVNQRPSVLPRGICLRGDVRGSEDFVIFGTVEGDIHLGGNLVVEEGGRVTGDVQAGSVTVRGALSGNIRADKSIRVEDHAAVIGDLIAPTILIQEGAKALGVLHVGETRSQLSQTTDPITQDVNTSGPVDDDQTKDPGQLTAPRPSWLIIQRRKANLRRMLTSQAIPPPPSPEFPAVARVTAHRRNHDYDPREASFSGFE